MKESTNFAEEFKQYECLFSDEAQHKILKENYEVTVDGEPRIMPEAFYNATKAVEEAIGNIKDTDVDSYDDHYSDGTNMQWRSMWNIFEPITFNIKALEQQLEALVTSMNTPEYKMNIDMDKDMLNDDGFLNICLSLESPLI